MKTPPHPLVPCLVSLFVVAGSTAVVGAAEVYKVDPIHSSIVFKIGHLGMTNVHGRFNDVSGTITFDKDNPSKSAVEFTVPIESVDTHVAKRDQHLKSPDFFNAKQFPVMTFKSRSVKETGKNSYQVAGDFTLHGVTKPLTIDFKKGGEGKGMQSEYRAGGETQFTLKRTDYGMNFMLNAVADEVNVELAIEGIRQ